MNWSGFSRADMIAIAAGGVLGAYARNLVGALTTTTAETFPAPSTLIANLSGCLLLGAFATLLVRSEGTRRRVLLAAGTGFCGSLTTFSTFAVDIAYLLRKTEPSSNIELAGTPTLTAVTYLVASVAGGALAFTLGRTAAKRAVT